MTKSAWTKHIKEDLVREANGILRSTLLTGNLAAMGPEHHQLRPAALCRLHAAVRRYTTFTLGPGRLARARPGLGRRAHLAVGDCNPRFQPETPVPGPGRPLPDSDRADRLGHRHFFEYR